MSATMKKTMDNNRIYRQYLEYLNELRSGESGHSTEAVESLDLEQFQTVWDRQSDVAKQHWKTRFELGYQKIVQREASKIRTLPRRVLSKEPKAA